MKGNGYFPLLFGLVTFWPEGRDDVVPVSVTIPVVCRPVDPPAQFGEGVYAHVRQSSAPKWPVTEIARGGQVVVPVPVMPFGYRHE